MSLQLALRGLFALVTQGFYPIATPVDLSSGIWTSGTWSEKEAGTLRVLHSGDFWAAISAQRTAVKAPRLPAIHIGIS